MYRIMLGRSAGGGARCGEEEKGRGVMSQLACTSTKHPTNSLIKYLVPALNIAYLQLTTATLSHRHADSSRAVNACA